MTILVLPPLPPPLPGAVSAGVDWTTIGPVALTVSNSSVAAEELGAFQNKESLQI